MTILATVALVCSAMTLALTPAYTWWLRRVARSRPRHPPAGGPIERPCLDVIVPVRDEEACIDGKLANLLASDYPRDRMAVWVVDGGSADSTMARARRTAAADGRVRVVVAAEAGKTAQVNCALALGSASIVVVTDADARLGPRTLGSLAAAIARDDGVGVAGTPVVPSGGHALERLHWRLTNQLRALEHQAGCCSIVAGPCYAFRRSLLESLPGDVVADDVYVACRAGVEGARVVLVDEPVGELRVPGSLAALVVHKHRKIAAYLREILRFAPRATRMGHPARGIFAWRAGLLVGGPLLAATSVTLALASAPAVEALATFGAAAIVAARFERTRDGLRGIALAGLLSAVTLLTLACYPFLGQTSRYRRIEAPAAPALEAPE